MCNTDISIHSKYECTYFPLKPLLEAKINENFEGPGCFFCVNTGYEIYNLFKSCFIQYLEKHQSTRKQWVSSSQEIFHFSYRNVQISGNYLVVS